MEISKEWIGEWVLIKPYATEYDEFEPELVPFVVPIKILKVRDGFMCYETFVAESYANPNDVNLTDDTVNEHLVVNKIKGMIDVESICEMHTIMNSERDLLLKRELSFNTRKRLEKVSTIPEFSSDVI